MVRASSHRLLLATGTMVALVPAVTIAIPISQERISPLLDAAARLLLVTRRRGKEVVTKGICPSVRSRRKNWRGAWRNGAWTCCCCAALSEPLLRALERRGVRVQPHLCGEVEPCLRAFDCGQLQRDEFRMPGCWGQHQGGACCHRRRAARLVKINFKPTKLSKT